MSPSEPGRKPASRGPLLPPWLRFPRESADPLGVLHRAAAGNLSLWLLLAAGAGLGLGGAPAASAAAVGAGAVLASVLLGWAVLILARPALRGRPSRAAGVLLAGYLLKIALALVALLTVPALTGLPPVWAVTGVVGAVLISLGTQVWVVWRLRIPYYAPVERQ